MSRTHVTSYKIDLITSRLEQIHREEAAKRLKRSAKTLECWRQAGLGPPFYRQRRAVRYLLSEVMA